MVSLWRRILLRQMWHPSVEDLVLFLDEPRSKRRVEAHLKACWSCRLALDKINRTILAYMEVRDTSFTGSRGFPKHALADFDRRLDQLALESEGPRLLPVFLSQQVQEFFFGQWGVRLATCIGCILIVALLIFRLTSSVSVSAEEVLSRVKKAEAEQLTRTSQPVLYEKLRLHRHSSPDRSEVVTWEIWSDTRNKRSRRKVEESQSISTEDRKSASENKVGKGRSRTQTGEDAGPIVPAAFADLEQLFRSHQANFEQPLSADNFEVWSHAFGGRLEKTMHSANGDDIFVLRASGEGPFQQNSVMSAELAIRKRDWQTVEERLQFKTTDGTTDYILEKVASTVIALNRLPPSIFGETSTPSAPAHTLKLPQTKLLVEEEQPSDRDLLVTEVEAWYGLHSVSACLGRPLNVAQTSRGRVEVQGVVEGEENKAQILAALQGIPHLISELRTAAQAGVASPAQFKSTESVTTIESGSVASPQKLVTEELLKKFLTTQECAEGPSEEKGRCIQQKIAHFSQGILSTSEATLAQAWALQRLANWYSHLSSNGLRLSTRGLVEIMVRDHLTSFRQERERLRILLTPVLGYLLEELALSSEQIDLKPSTAPQGGRLDWVTDSQRLCSVVERITNLLLGMFVETNIPVSDIKGATKELLPAMASLDETFEKLEGELVIEFSGTSKVVSNDKPQGK